ncbi:MAG: VPLPA-CTERM sorting domain-containing protein [Nitrospira sp.]|nr:VPLPA-CTERM sorting domain-containing protein [Nitrospira sp.]
MKTSMRAAMLVGALIAGVAAPFPVFAIIYPLDYVFSPSVGPVTPLGTVTLTDLGASVQFDVLNQAGTGTKLDSLYFNFAHGSLNPNQLTFSNVSAAASTYNTLLATSTSATVAGLKADGDGYFDGKFAYSANNFLGHGQTLSFRLNATGQDLDVSDFHLFSLPGGGAGSYIMASHIQSLPDGSSLWVGTVAPVPLPAAVWLFGSGVAGVIAFARRRWSV